MSPMLPAQTPPITNPTVPKPGCEYIVEGIKIRFLANCYKYSMSGTVTKVFYSKTDNAAVANGNVVTVNQQHYRVYLLPNTTTVHKLPGGTGPADPKTEIDALKACLGNSHGIKFTEDRDESTANHKFTLPSVSALISSVLSSTPMRVPASKRASVTVSGSQPNGNQPVSQNQTPDQQAVSSQPQQQPPSHSQIPEPPSDSNDHLFQAIFTQLRIARRDLAETDEDVSSLREQLSELSESVKEKLSAKLPEWSGDFSGITDWVEKTVEEMATTLDERLYAFEETSSKRLVELAQTVDHTVQNLETGLSDKLQVLEKKVGEKISAVETTLRGYISQSEQNNQQAMQDLEQRMNQKLSAAESRHRQDLQSLEARLKTSVPDCTSHNCRRNLAPEFDNPVLCTPIDATANNSGLQTTAKSHFSPEPKPYQEPDEKTVNQVLDRIPKFDNSVAMNQFVKLCFRSCQQDPNQSTVESNFWARKIEAFLPKRFADTTSAVNWSQTLGDQKLQNLSPRSRLIAAGNNYTRQIQKMLDPETTLRQTLQDSYDSATDYFNAFRLIADSIEETALSQESMCKILRENSTGKFRDFLFNSKPNTISAAAEFSTQADEFENAGVGNSQGNNSINSIRTRAGPGVRKEHCVNWSNGTCSYGKKCQFEHDPDKLFTGPYAQQNRQSMMELEKKNREEYLANKKETGGAKTD